MAYGMGDPLRFLAAEDGPERILVDKILEAVLEIKRSEDKMFWRNMEAVVQAGVAKAFG